MLEGIDVITVDIGECDPELIDAANQLQR